MIKIVQILDVNIDYIICLLSNNEAKRVSLGPLIASHRHLKGIEKLKDSEYIKMAKIGIFGEIFWPETIENSDGYTWNYDISPEYIFHFGEDIFLKIKK